MGQKKSTSRFPVKPDSCREVFREACDSGNLTHLQAKVDEGVFKVNCYIPRVSFHLDPTTAGRIRQEKKQMMKLTYGKKVNTDRIDSDTPLHRAVKYQGAEVIRFLLDRGANILAENHEGDRAFDMAFKEYARLRAIQDDDRSSGYGSQIELAEEIIGVLLAHGRDRDLDLLEASAEINNYKTYFTLCKGVFDNDLEVVRSILSVRKFIEFEDFHPDSQPVVLASALNRTEIVKIFYEFSDLVMRKEIFFKNIDMRNRKIVAMCIDQGLDPTVTQSSGRNAFHLACENADLEMVKLLLAKYNFDVDAKDVVGFTPLQLTFLPGNSAGLETLRFLVHHFEIDKIAFNPDLRYLLFRDKCEAYTLLLEHAVSDLPMHRCFSRSKDPEVINKYCHVLNFRRKMCLLDPSHIGQVEKNFLHLVWKHVNRDYHKELDELKKVKISETPTRTLFDYLLFEPGDVVRYSRNVILDELYERSEKNFCKIYKNYGFALNYKYRLGKRRKNLIASATKLMNFALGAEIPEHISREIFKYSSDETLKHLCL